MSLNLSRSLRQSPPPDFLASPAAVRDYIVPILDFLYTARPTAVNLGAAVRRLKNRLQESTAHKTDAAAIVKDLISEANAVADEDVDRNKVMSRWGGDWIVQRVRDKGETGDAINVLTVCNTGSLATSVWIYHTFIATTLANILRQGYGTALGVITYLHETWNLEKAYYTQTAPYHQGSRSGFR